MSASPIPALDQESSNTEINSSAHQSTVDNDKIVFNPVPNTTLTHLTIQVDEKLDLLDPSRENEPKSTPFASSDDLEVNVPKLGDAQNLDNDETGILRSKRGAAIAIVSSTAQMIDNIYVSSVIIAIPSIQRDLEISNAHLPWILSAFSLAYGGLLLLAGVMSDRFGPRPVFALGMLWLTLWSLAVSFAPNEVSLIIFRALQGIGAATTVPSAIGTICKYFRGRDQNTAMAIYGAGGPVGWVVGLIIGGVLAGTIGWRWIFRLFCPITLGLAIIAWFIFPKDRRPATDEPKPSLDFGGAFFGTVSMVLLVFALSSSEMHGWGAAIVIAPLIISFIVLGVFIWIQHTVKNPIMPLSLWKTPGFAVIFCTALAFHAWFGTSLYYAVTVAQEVLLLSPLATAVRFVPMGCLGFCVTMALAVLFNWLSIKTLVVGGLTISVVANVSSAVAEPGDSFWSSCFITSLLVATSCSIVYNVLAVALVASVPTNAKSLAGGLVNTAFQIGTALGLSLCSVAQYSLVDPEGHTSSDPRETMRGLAAALWVSMGMAGLALSLALFGMQRGIRAENAAHRQ